MKTKSLYPYLVVADFEQSIHFYSDVLGFSVKHNAMRADGGHVAVLSSEAGYDLELMDPIQSGPFQFHPGDFGLRMNVDDIDAAYEELKQTGYQLLGGPIETKVGKNLLLKDPSGTNITLIQHIKK